MTLFVLHTGDSRQPFVLNVDSVWSSKELAMERWKILVHMADMSVGYGHERPYDFFIIKDFELDKR